MNTNTASVIATEDTAIKVETSVNNTLEEREMTAADLMEMGFHSC